MTEKKGFFANLFGGKKGCCGIGKEAPKQKKGGCCAMEIAEEPEQSCCNAEPSGRETPSESPKKK